MKKILGTILFIVMMVSLTACAGSSTAPSEEERLSVERAASETAEPESQEPEISEAEPESQEQEISEAVPEVLRGKRTLIVYFSYSGVTRGVAERLREKTGGDLFELIPVEPYSEDMYEASDRAEKERESGNLPELTEEFPDLSGYDVILVGGPVWSETLAPPVMTYLQSTDFTGKTVAPFWTYNNNQGDYEGDVRSQIQNGETGECLGLSYVSRYSEEELNQALDNWLQTIGLSDEGLAGREEARIVIRMGDTEIEAVLNGSEAAKEFQSMLPVTLSMTRMGEHEYYGALEQALTHTEDLQTGYAVGDLAFWTPGDLLAFYFDEPEKAPEGLMILGNITTDLAVFEQMAGSVEAEISLAE